MYVNKLHEALSGKSPRVGDAAVIVTAIHAEYLELLDKGIIFPYPQNRIDGNFNEEVCEDVCERFKPYGFGTVTLAKMSDGRYQMADAHSRTQGIVNRAKLGKMSDIDLAQSVSFHLHHENDHLKVYETLNNHKGHSGQMKISNTDFPAGRWIQDLLDEVGLPLQKKHWLNLSDIIYAYSAEAFEVDCKDPYLYSVFSARHKYTGAMLKGNLRFEDYVTPKDRLNIKEALLYLKGVLQAVHDNRGLDRNKYPSILKSPGLIMFLLTDFLTEKTVSKQKLETTGTVIIGSAKAVLQACQIVARRNKRVLKPVDIKIIRETILGKGQVKKDILTDAKACRDSVEAGSVSNDLMKSIARVKKLDYSLREASQPEV